MAGRGRSAAFGIASIAAAAVVFTGACGDDDDNGQKGTPGEPGAQEKVIAPYGFTLEIQSAEIPADPTKAETPPTVTFRVAGENGAPVDDLQQRIKASAATPPAFPQVRAPTFTLARLEPDLSYRSYYLNQAGNQATNGGALPADDAAWADRVTALGNGTYRFELAPLPQNPTAEERARTHTVAVYGSNVPSQGAEEQAATSTFNFVPAGGAADTKQVVSAQACNTCHAPAVRAHGRRLGVQACLTCHTSQTVDPDTGNSVEFVEMIHKIHYGGDRVGAPYEIVGFGGTRFSFTDPFINDVRNCQLCHQGEDAERSVSAPSQRACLTCHTQVKFDGTAAGGQLCDPERKDTADCNHFPIAQNTACATCHTPEQIRSQHVPMTEIAKQFRYEIQSVTVDAARIPTARIRVLDTATNQPRDLEADPAYKASASSLNVKFGWPSAEYTNAGAGTTAPGQPVSVAVVGSGALRTTGVAKVAGQAGTYDVTSPVAVPDGVGSATAMIDGHPVVHGENVPVVNATSDFGVGGAAAAPRRQVVAVDKCNACHGVVSAHGQNRNGNVSACVVCHNPKATDAQRRQGLSGADATEQSVDFKVLIHGIHSADIRKDPLVVYGFGNARHEFPGEVPHGVGNCNLCHANDSWRLPMKPEVLDPVVSTNGTPGDQTDDVTAGRVRMVCTACHDQVRFAQETPALPMCNTVVPANSTACFHSGAAQADDSTCAACHGTGAPYDIATRHPIQ